MNEFIEQFLIECHELVTQATDDLLALEEDPADADRLDGAFRAFHTLKGAAGIVDFDAMGLALHAAEDVLSALRSGEGRVSAQVISDCLTCLDQVLDWLEEMRESGEVPAGAKAQAEAIVRRFKGAAIETVAEEPSSPEGWAQGLRDRRPEAAARVAVRYAPDVDAFFRGEDPLAVLAALPGLSALEIEGPKAWPPMDELDPYQSRLAFLALCDADAATINAALEAVRSQVSVEALPVPAEDAITPAALALLKAQLDLLNDATGEAMPGRAESARRVGVNVLRGQGRAPQADRLAAASPDALGQVLESILGGGEERQPAADPRQPAAHDAVTRALRVDVERIDALVNLAGELTVAKNALAHAAQLALEGVEAEVLARTLRTQHAQLERLVNELQRSVLNIRVLPMRHVFQRFPRPVREMVMSLGKPARLFTEGEETEADKTIVEGLFDPLLHVIRNALDHGVEAPQTRLERGKPPSAAIRLRAAHEGAHVLVEVSDDGGGIDVERIREVAVRNGIVDAAAAQQMDDAAALDLIFAPGFSTAREVTAMSGRGVGMDAVRTAVGRMGGQVSIHTVRGEGTTIRFTLPFSVMMTAVLTVEVGAQAFGVPLDAVGETVRVPRDRIAPVGAARAFVLRDQTTPLIDLAEALGERRVVDRQGEATVVVVRFGDLTAGIEVDQIGDRAEVMLKPMEGLLAGMHGVAGTTILGDGRVLIVLDLQALLQ